MIKLKVFVGLTMIVLLGCKKEPEYTSATVEIVDKSRAYRNTLMPEELRTKLLEGVSTMTPAPAPAAEGHGEKKEEGHGENKAEHGEKKDEHASGPPVKKPSEVGADGFARMRIQVYLVEKTPGVLNNKNYKFEYGPGGGELDLADYVNAKKHGTFYLAFQADPQEIGEMKVWYLSNARTRKMGVGTVGSGCQSFFDITDYFNKEMKDKGFVVNSTDQRYVSALAGQYFINIKGEKRVSIGTIDVIDSRYKNLLCR